MTIDINELREAIQMFGSQAVNEGDLNELLDRLEAAEKERDALRAELLDAKETVRELFHGAGVANMTIATLQARVEAMEKQEPVGWIGLGPRDGRIEFSTHRPAPSVMHDFNVKPLYLAPGAQGEEK